MQVSDIIKIYMAGHRLIKVTITQLVMLMIIGDDMSVSKLIAHLVVTITKAGSGLKSA
jgi:hypothetical protein